MENEGKNNKNKHAADCGETLLRSTRLHDTEHRWCVLWRCCRRAHISLPSSTCNRNFWVTRLWRGRFKLMTTHKPLLRLRNTRLVIRKALRRRITEAHKNVYTLRSDGVSIGTMRWRWKLNHHIRYTRIAIVGKRVCYSYENVSFTYTRFVAHVIKIDFSCVTAVSHATPTVRCFLFDLSSPQQTHILSPSLSLSSFLFVFCNRLESIAGTRRRHISISQRFAAHVCSLYKSIKLREN